MSKTLLNTGIGIFFFGLVVGLPNIDTLIVDFTGFETLTITLMRLGLMAVGFYFLNKVIN